MSFDWCSQNALHIEDVMHPEELHGFSSQLENRIVLSYFIILCCCLPAILLAILTILKAEELS